jgi:translation elongation factor EF-1alpha
MDKEDMKKMSTQEISEQMDGDYLKARIKTKQDIKDGKLIRLNKSQVKMHNDLQKEMDGKIFECLNLLIDCAYPD